MYGKGPRVGHLFEEAVAASVFGSIQASSAVNGNTLSSASFTCGGADRVLYVLAGIADTSSVGNISSVTWNGSGLTQIGTTITYGSNGKVELFRLIAPAAASAPVVLNCAASEDVRWLFAVAVQDVDQVTPNGTVAQATGTNASPTVNAAGSSGQLVLDFMSWVDLATGALTATAGAGQASLQEIEGAVLLNAVGGGMSSETASGASTTMSWALSGAPTNWGTYALALNDAAGGGGSTRGMPFGARGTAFNGGRALTGILKRSLWLPPLRSRFA